MCGRIPAGSIMSTSQQDVLMGTVIFIAVFVYVLHRQLSIRAVTARSFVLVAILFVDETLFI
ncbi:MAG: hypothetical protein ACR2OE_12085 [Thermomicrobiales bacterium]